MLVTTHNQVSEQGSESRPQRKINNSFETVIAELEKYEEGTPPRKTVIDSGE